MCGKHLLDGNDQMYKSRQISEKLLNAFSMKVNHQPDIKPLLVAVQRRPTFVFLSSINQLQSSAVPLQASLLTCIKVKLYF